MPPTLKVWQIRLWLAAIALIYILRALPALWHCSQTVDEPYHIGAAVAIYDARAHILGVQHPPLPRLVAGLPLKLMGAATGITSRMSRREDAAFEAGTHILCDRPGDYWPRLRAARAAMLLFPLLALHYAFLIGCRLAGPWAGLLGATLLSLDPTLLGHGMWVCTDAAAAAGWLAVIYHTLDAAGEPSRRTLAALGVALGLGISCKFSVLFAIPILAPWLAWRTRAAGWRSLLVGTLGVFAVAFLSLWATYLFDIGPLANSDTLATAPQWTRMPAWIKAIPLPMPSLLIGLGRLAAHSAQGHGTELFGHTSDRGWWYYFPVLRFTKTQVAALILTGLGVVRSIRCRCGLILVIAATFFVLVSMAGSIQIGIRHVLPAIAASCIVAGIAAARWRWATLLVVVAALESLASPLDAIAYYNLPARPWATQIALGSNYDWGQDLPTLGGVPGLSAIYPLGYRQDAVFKAIGLDPALIDAPPHGLIAVSLTRRLLGPGDFAFLRDAQYKGQIAHGFALYQLP